MARMLYILSVIAWIAAGATFFICLQERPWQDAPTGEEARGSSVEEFIEAQENGSHDSPQQIPPLVRQAQLLADYLNPPPPKPIRSSASREKASVVSATTEVRPAKMSVKFELHGISYHRSKPSRSMALVWDAADGHRWVKQGAQIRHIVIEKIDGTSISYSDEHGVREMALGNLDEATTMVADTGQSDPVPSKPHRQGPPVQRWAPVRGIRQMPAERMAAKLGRIERDTDADM